MSQVAMLDNDNKRLAEEKEKQEATIQNLTSEVKSLTSERDKYEWEAANLRKETEVLRKDAEERLSAERDSFHKVLEDTKAQYEQRIIQLKEADEKHQPAVYLRQLLVSFGMRARRGKRRGRVVIPPVRAPFRENAQRKREKSPVPIVGADK